MRSLMAIVVGLSGCVADAQVEVTFELPAGASLTGRSVRIIVGEETDDGFRTLRGAGGPATADPRTFDLTVPEGDNRIARVVIYQGEFEPVLHGQSDPFSIASSSEPTPVTVKLGLPPEGSIVATRPEEGGVGVDIVARRWSAIRLGLLPGQPTHEATRPAGDAENDSVERVSVIYPLDMVECPLESGCPVMIFVDFLSRTGAHGPTATATVTVDVVPPSLTTRARIDGGTTLGGGSRLIVDVEATESVTDVVLSLTQRTRREGMCIELLGPYACSGADRKFTCTVDAPIETCDATYTVAVAAKDGAGNQTSQPGADIAIDNLPPVLSLAGVICSADVLVTWGQAIGATEAALRDAAGNILASTSEPSFSLAASSSIAEELVAIDGGGNETSRPIVCP